MNSPLDDVYTKANVMGGFLVDVFYVLAPSAPVGPKIVLACTGSIVESRPLNLSPVFYSYSGNQTHAYLCRDPFHVVRHV